MEYKAPNREVKGNGLRGTGRSLNRRACAARVRLQQACVPDSMRKLFPIPRIPVCIMYAIVEAKGKQYKVEPGQEVVVDLMKAEPGEKVELDQVLLVGGLKKGELRVGTPTVEGARVVAEVMRHEKGPKLLMVKYRDGLGKKKGHRQRYTRLVVKDIILG